MCVQQLIACHCKSIFPFDCSSFQSRLSGKAAVGLFKTCTLGYWQPLLPSRFFASTSPCIQVMLLVSEGRCLSIRQNVALLKPGYFHCDSKRSALPWQDHDALPWSALMMHCHVLTQFRILTVHPSCICCSVKLPHFCLEHWTLMWVQPKKCRRNSLERAEIAFVSESSIHIVSQYWQLCNSWLRRSVEKVIWKPVTDHVFQTRTNAPIRIYLLACWFLLTWWKLNC